MFHHLYQVVLARGEGGDLSAHLGTHLSDAHMVGGKQNGSAVEHTGLAF